MTATLVLCLHSNTNVFLYHGIHIGYMDTGLQPNIKRQLILVTIIFGMSLVLTYLFGFLLGCILNVLLLVLITFYIRRNQWIGLRKFGFEDETIGDRRPRTFVETNLKLEYLCLICGSKISGRTCEKCGSHMKKPRF